MRPVYSANKTGGYVVYTIEDLFNDYMHILSKRVGKDQAADYMWAKGEHQEAAVGLLR